MSVITDVLVSPFFAFRWFSYWNRTGRNGRISDRSSTRRTSRVDMRSSRSAAWDWTKASPAPSSACVCMTWAVRGSMRTLTILLIGSTGQKWRSGWRWAAGVKRQAWKVLEILADRFASGSFCFACRGERLYGCVWSRASMYRIGSKTRHPAV